MNLTGCAIIKCMHSHGYFLHKLFNAFLHDNLYEFDSIIICSDNIKFMKNPS